MAMDNDTLMMARSSPAGLAYVSSNGAWIPAPHLILLSKKIVDVATGRIPRLMVFMPPRHGKSELISRYTPAWYLGRWPDKKVMLASYADTFSAAWGRRARDVYSDIGDEVFGQSVNKETAGGASWEVSGREGIMVTAGVGGGLTGKGANLLIIDDPVKNQQDARSAKMQEDQIDWWKSTARTRLQKGSGVILVMTRWHEGDLAGRLLQEQYDEDADEWEILSLPGLAEPQVTVSYPSSKTLTVGPDPLGRAEGEALWPEMFDEETLAQTKKASGSYWFNAMYQQRPAAAEGELFKRANFRYFEKLGGNLVRIFKDSAPEVFDIAYGTKFCTIDCAESEKKSADYTVVSTWVLTVNKDLLLWDRQRVQFNGPNLLVLIRRVFYEQQPAMMCIEAKSSGTAIIEQLTLEGLPVIPLHPDADKITRALPATARYEAHTIYHPQGEKWVSDEWEPELLNFPNGVNDDQVDTVAYAALQLPRMGAGLISGAQSSETGQAGARTGSGGMETAGLLDEEF